MADENTGEEEELEEEPVEDDPDPSSQAEDGADPSKKTDDEDTEEPDIPVRSSASHIIARQRKKIDRLRSQQEKDDDDDDFIPPDEDLTTEARTAVQREVERQLEPLTQTLVSKADQDELKELLSSNPDAERYEKRIRAYMNHEAYKGVPPTVIYHHLAFNDAKSSGARKKEVADREAQQQRGGGSQRRPSERPAGGVPTKEELDDMTDEELEALEQDARQGKFVKD